MCTIRKCTVQDRYPAFKPLTKSGLSTPTVEIYTTDEDDFLKRGIDKHEFGQWTAILRDPDFRFQKGRLTDSLKKRAELRLKANE